MMVNNENISRHLDFIVAFKEALKENLEGNTGLEEVLDRLNNYKDLNRMDVCSIIFKYAMDLAMRQVVPVFLQCLKEANDPDFINELADTLDIGWGINLSFPSAESNSGNMVN